MNFAEITQLAKNAGANKDFSYKDWRFSDSQLYDFVKLVLATNWKPMKDAPLDGTKILLKQGEKIVIGYFWEYLSHNSNYCHKNWITGWNREFDCPESVLQPTAWMKIP